MKSRKIVAISATEELAVAQVKELLSTYEAQGYVPNGNITVAKTYTSTPGDAPWIRAELPIIKAS